MAEAARLVCRGTAVALRIVAKTVSTLIALEASPPK